MADQKPRKRVTELKVHEISFVDKPAVPKARFLIVKRDEAKGGSEMNLGKDNPGDEKDKQTPQVTKVAEEGLTEKQEGATEKAREMITSLMEMRRDLPGPIRRLVTEMDFILDEMTRARDPDEEEEEKSEEKRKDPEKREDPEEKRKDPEKREDPEKEEEKEKARDPEKPEEKQCPPNMEFDPDKGECVPKKKKAEKSEEEKSAPRDGGGGNPKAAETLELSAAQKKRVAKLLEKYKT